MGFRNDSYAKVWEVKAGKGNYSDVRLSISIKDKRTDEYVQDFQGWVRFIGHANDPAPTEGAKIKLVNVDVSNSYDKDKKVTYWNAKCFEYEDADSNRSTNDGFMNIPEGVEDEVPF